MCSSDLERLRTRIASDLHDDIGSNLSVIAGLGEVLRHERRRIDPNMSESLGVIAGVSTRSMDAMADIVWAIDPHKDHLSDLAHRMRRWASDALTPPFPGSCRGSATANNLAKPEAPSSALLACARMR